MWPRWKGFWFYSAGGLPSRQFRGLVLVSYGCPRLLTGDSCARRCHLTLRAQMRDCRMEGSREDGGLYEVCVVDNKWLVGRREQENLRLDRCITPANNDLEPWFFSFRKLR
eukprot:jgi/Mesvir1/4086/Mv24196-RA.1